MDEQQSEQPEAVPISDVLEYYKHLSSQLHEQLAIAHGQIKSRDRQIEKLLERAG